MPDTHSTPPCIDAATYAPATGTPRTFRRGYLRMLQGWGIVGVAVLSSGCATWWPGTAKNHLADPVYMAQMGPTLPEGKMGERLAQCYDKFAETELRRRAAGIRHAGYLPVDGFPYLRVDRLMVSFSGDIDNLELAGPWLESMREYAHFSRGIELSEMDMDAVERSQQLHEMSFCSVWLSLLAFEQEAARGRMIEAVRNSMPPPAKPARLRSGLASATAMADLHTWRPVASERADSEESTLEHFAACDRDPLGRVGLVNDQWLRFAAMHAPFVRSPKPLTSPVLTNAVTVQNTGPAQMHFMPSFARVGNQTLLQFSYYIWLPHNTAADSGLDGLIWRTTLDLQGHPLTHESINFDGSQHRWFAAQPLKPKADPKPDRTLVGAKQVELTLGSRGQLMSVAPLNPDALADAKDAVVAHYDELSEAQLPDGRARSMFDNQGRLRSPGPVVFMIGQHPAIDAYGHAFDDPRLITTAFDISAGSLQASTLPACKDSLDVAAYTPH